MNYFLENHDSLLYLIAGVSFVLELTVIGMSGPLLFFAIACVLTGLLNTFGLVTTWQYEVLALGVFTVISAMLLWKPLKKLQGDKKVYDTSSDMIGQRVMVSETVTQTSGSIRYSGINWQARLEPDASDQVIETNTQVTIFAVDGTTMLVKK